MSKPRIVLAASGSGTIAQAIIDAVIDQKLDAHIVGLICDRPKAAVLSRAQRAGIEAHLIPMTEDRKVWDQVIFDKLVELDPDLVVSAGFMRIFSPSCVSKFKIVNSHPALLPLFPGAHAVRDALLAGVTRTGSTIHWVDSGVDTGQIIAQEAVEITASDTEESLHERIKIVERRLYVATLQKLLVDVVRSA
jgi:phosphoribosylglycinamide formyltransferase 1